jgi:hypothetical protein
MTQPDNSDDSQHTSLGMVSDEELRIRWYRYAAMQPGSLDSLLAILRTRLGQTREEQQSSFAIAPNDFLRLQSLRMPRASQFAYDAERIATACHVGKPFEFIQALLLARGLLQSSGAGQTATASQHSESSRNGETVEDEQSYEAAYDAPDAADDQEDDE